MINILIEKEKENKKENLNSIENIKKEDLVENKEEDNKNIINKDKQNNKEETEDLKEIKNDNQINFSVLKVMILSFFFKRYYYLL